MRLPSFLMKPTMASGGIVLTSKNGNVCARSGVSGDSLPASDTKFALANLHKKSKPIYIKEEKITEKNAHRVYKPMDYFIEDIDGVRYSARRYYVDENGAIRIRNWAGSVNAWINHTKPSKVEVSAMIHKTLKPVGFVRGER